MLCPQMRTPVFELHTAYHRLRVTDNAGIRLLKFERNRQSSMLIDDPYETDFEYPGYFHLAMAIRPDAARTLVIGLGGGTVVKRMWRDYPWMHLDAVEIDPDVIEVARAFFALPQDPRIRIFEAEGRGFVRLASDIYDIVVIDAFDDDRVPVPLATEEFMRDVRDRMSEGGVIAYNYIGAIYGAESRLFRSLYRTASNVWRNLWVFPIGLNEDVTDRTRNVILLASDTDVDADAFLERIASRVEGMVTVPGFESFGQDWYRGGIRTGDVPILVERRPVRARRESR